jgi:hypothetical protein
LSIYSEESFTYALLKDDFENHFKDFELFWYSDEVDVLREKGLLVL